jgi:hypothetical protein
LIERTCPPRSTLYDYFGLWSWDSALDRIHAALYDSAAKPRARRAYRRDHRQSVKSTEKGASCRRLAKGSESLNHKALAFLRPASIRLMLRKLCNPT